MAVKHDYDLMVLRLQQEIRDLKAGKKNMVNYEFVLIDLTTSKTPAAMKPAPHFTAIIDALFEQAMGPYAAHHGTPVISFRVGTDADRKPNEIAIHFRDDIPEAPGALAFHQVVNGIPDIEIGVDLFTNIMSDSDGLLSGVSHELLELFGDAGGNGWKDRQNSERKMDAEELCDFVQNTGYKASNGGHVSNFVLPSFFIPGSAGPWDFLGVMKFQYDYSNGYGMVASEPSTVKQVMGMHAHMPLEIHGELTELQKKRKSHPYSRTYRRGLRLAA